MLIIVVMVLMLFQMRVVLTMTMIMIMMIILMIRRADSGIVHPSSSSPFGHWGIVSHLVRMMMMRMMLLLRMMYKMKCCYGTVMHPIALIGKNLSFFSLLMFRKRLVQMKSWSLLKMPFLLYSVSQSFSSVPSSHWI